MKKIIIYSMFLLIVCSLAMAAAPVPVFTSPATTGTTVHTAAQTLTAGSCPTNYKYTIYYGLSSQPNITLLSADVSGTTSVTVSADGTYFYQALCGNNYQPTNYSKLLAHFSFDNAYNNYTTNKTNSTDNRFIADMGNITLANSVTGKVNQALTFNGRDTIINTTFPDMTSYATTISTWFKASPTSTNGYILTLGNGQNNTMGLYLTSTNTLSAYVFDNETTGYGGGFVPITTGTWYNAMLIYTPNPGGTLSLYLNGELQNSVALTANASLKINPNSELLIGGEGSWGTEYYFNGTVDEVLIYNNTFTNNEIKSLYLLQNNNTGYSSVGNWTYTRLTSEETSMRAGCNSTKMIIYAGLALIAVAMIVLSAFGIVGIFSGSGGDVASFGAIGIGLIGLAIVVMIGYYLISVVGASVCLM